MGKRYFCDYCDRSFQDNLHNRKKHLSGVQHQRSKKAWYDLFRDASEILAEEQTKKLCRRFIQSDASEILAEEQTKKLCRRFIQSDQRYLSRDRAISLQAYIVTVVYIPFCNHLSCQCDFGPGCRFSHMTVQDLEALKEQVEAEKRVREEQRRLIPPCNIESWLEERAKKRSICSDSAAVSEPPTYHLPPGWPPLSELPPSLHPPSASEWDDPASLEWG